MAETEKTSGLTEAVEEIKNADEDRLKEIVEKWFEQTRTSGMKIGASYISAAIFGIIQKHLKKQSKASLRDYQRCIQEIVQIISTQLNTEQNDLEDKETVDEQENSI